MANQLMDRLIASGDASVAGVKDGFTIYNISIPFVLDNFLTRDSYVSTDYCACDAERDEDCECGNEFETFREVIEQKAYYAESRGLTESIREKGLLSPLAAEIRFDDEIHQVDGHHRLAALIDLGYTTAPYIVVCLDDYPILDRSVVYRRFIANTT